MRAASQNSSASPSPGGWGGKAEFNGAVVLTEAPASSVAAYLPRGLALRAGPHSDAARATARGGSKGQHPLLFVFGEMREGGAHLLGVHYSVGISYREVAVLVPYVCHAGDTAPFLFAQQMFADDPRAVALGNAVYGYRKQLARIDATGPAYTVHHHGCIVFSGSGSVAGAWSGAAAERGRGPTWLRELLELPVLGRHATGQLVGSRFDWDFGNASLCDLEASLEWEAPQRRLQASSLAARALGVRGLLWRTSPPRWIGSA